MDRKIHCSADSAEKSFGGGRPTDDQISAEFQAVSTARLSLNGTFC